MSENIIQYLTYEDIQDKDILFNYIYSNEQVNYYACDDFSKDFYIYLAYCGFISTSITLKDKFYLLAEIQFEYALLDFHNLHISKSVNKLIEKNNYDFFINKNLSQTLEKLEQYHKTNWLEKQYRQLIASLKSYQHKNIDFQIISAELYDKKGELIAGELGYKIGRTYTSLTGFSSKKKEYKNWGKLQMVLLAKHLENSGFSFWNLGHPYMQYKFDLGAKVYKRLDFLRRWYEAISS